MRQGVDNTRACGAGLGDIAVGELGGNSCGSSNGGSEQVDAELVNDIDESLVDQVVVAVIWLL